MSISQLKKLTQKLSPSNQISIVDHKLWWDLILQIWLKYMFKLCKFGSNMFKLCKFGWKIFSNFANLAEKYCQTLQIWLNFFLQTLKIWLKNIFKLWKFGCNIFSNFHRHCSSCYSIIRNPYVDNGFCFLLKRNFHLDCNQLFPALQCRSIFPFQVPIRIWRSVISINQKCDNQIFSNFHTGQFPFVWLHVDDGFCFLLKRNSHFRKMTAINLSLAAT